MENKFFKIENREEWNNLLDKVLFKTFFHSLAWEEFLEKNFKWLKFERYNYQDKALLSLANIEGKKLISHPFCEYGGPLPLVEKIDGQSFQKDLFDQFKIPLKISFHPKLLNYFENFGGQENLRETYLIENIHVQRVDQLGGGMDRNRKRSLKIAEEYGLKVRKCEELKDLKSLYVLYIKSLKKYKVPVYPFSFFKFFFKNPEAEILLAEKDKKIVGGNIFLFYNKIIHSFLCGFDNKQRKFGVHDSILWSELKADYFRKEKEKRNPEIFDFGASKKASSISDFKSRWGGKVYPIFEMKNYSGEPKFKDSFLRDVWSYLPVSLIKVLSPYFIKYKL